MILDLRWEPSIMQGFAWTAHFSVGNNGMPDHSGHVVAFVASTE